MKKILNILSFIVIFFSSFINIISCKKNNSKNEEKEHIVDSSSFKENIRDKVQFYINRYLKIGINENYPCIKDENLPDISNNFMSKLQSIYSYSDLNDEIIAEDEFKNPISSYINSILKTQVLPKIRNDDTINNFFTDISDDDILKVNDDDTKYVKRSFLWDPNTDTPIATNFFGYDTLEKYKEEFNSLGTKNSDNQDQGQNQSEEKLSFVFNIKITNFIINLNYKDIYSSSVENIQLSNSDAEFYIVNSDGYNKFIGLIENVANVLNEVVGKITLIFDPISGKTNLGLDNNENNDNTTDSILNFSLKDNEQFIYKIFKDQIILKINSAIAGKEVEIKNLNFIDDSENDEETREIGNWTKNKYQFAENYFNFNTLHPDINETFRLGNRASYKMLNKEFKEKLLSDLDNNFYDFKDSLDTLIKSKWSIEQVNSLKWDNTKIPWEKILSNVIAYGRIELTNWKFNGILVNRWKIPFIIFNKSFQNSYYNKIISELVSKIFSGDNIIPEKSNDAYFWKKAKIQGIPLKFNLFSKLGLGSDNLLGGILDWAQDMLSNNEVMSFCVNLENKINFDNFLKTNKKFDDALSLLKNNIKNNFSANLINWTESLLSFDDSDNFSASKENINNIIDGFIKEMKFYSNIPSLYNYNVNLWHTLDSFWIPNDSRRANHLSYYSLVSRTIPEIWFSIGGYRFNLTSNWYTGYAASGIYWE